MFLDPIISSRSALRDKRCVWWRAAVALVVVGVVTAGTACRASPKTHRSEALGTANDSAIQVTDDAGHVIRLARPAQRIISLIPSVTETLIALGLADRVVGRTRYDVDPHIASATLVGGGIDPSIETIVALHPDVVFAWENDKREVAKNKLAMLGVPVFSLRTEDTSDVFRGITKLGRLTGRDSAATVLATSLHAQLDEVRHSVAGNPVPRVLFVVYNDPPMTAGAKTFIGELISLAGGQSIFSDLPQLWPNVAMEEIVRRQPDIVVIPIGQFKNSSLARLRATTGWRDLRAVREGRVVSVPANLVSRPGAHVGEAARLLRDAFHPEVVRTVVASTGTRP